MSTRKDVQAAVNCIARQAFKDGANFALYTLSRHLHISSRDIRLSGYNVAIKSALLAQRVIETIGSGGRT